MRDWKEDELNDGQLHGTDWGARGHKTITRGTQTDWSPVGPTQEVVHPFHWVVQFRCDLYNLFRGTAIDLGRRLRSLAWLTLDLVDSAISQFHLSLLQALGPRPILDPIPTAVGRVPAPSTGSVKRAR